MESNTPQVTAQESRSPIGKRHPHTHFFVQALNKVPIGEVFTYEQCEAMTGLTKSQFWKYLESAIEIVLKNDNICFECVINVGYKRLAPEVVPVTTNKKQIKKLRGVASRYRARLETVDSMELTPEARIEHTLGLTNVAIMEAASTPKSQGALRKSIATNAIADPIENMKKNKDELMRSLASIWK